MKKFVAVFVGILFFGLTFLPAPVSAADADFCPGPGNNLIDNISANVLVNLRRDAGEPNCWLTATFLFRTNDLANPNLANFFRVAAANKVYPIIRIGSENNGDYWPQIDPSLAQVDASRLSQAVSAAGFPKDIYVEMGNEINFNNEWGGNSNPSTYATSFISFANAITASNLKVMLPPLSLADGATAINANIYYTQLKQALDQQLKGQFNCDQYITNSNPLDDYMYGQCLNQIPAWENQHIDGYGLNLYANAGDINSILNDKNRVINALIAAGFKVNGKGYVITEVGLPGGIYSPDVGPQSCSFWKAIQNSSSGYNFITSTIFSRDSQMRVRAFYFDQNGNCSSDASHEYQVAVINLGGSTTFNNNTGYPPSNSTNYLPLGSLEECPSTVNTASSCKPVPSLTGICNSECSPPVEIDQSLSLTGSPGCFTNGSQSCHANIKIQGNMIPVPGQIKELADYFEGTLDAEKTPASELDALQKALRTGYTDPRFTEALQKAGVARKLFPTEVQDDLRCKFIKYVQTTSNTKYKDFAINGTLIRNLPTNPCKPTDFPGWSRIPLFPDDNSLGKIVFVSPSLATTKPLEVAIPETQRLNLVTKTIQSLLIAPGVVNQQNKPKTFGKTISISWDNTCTPTKDWEELYQAADFKRGVSCTFDKPLVLGSNNMTGCVLLPDGNLQCRRGETVAGGLRYYTNANGGNQATVQVRTVFPDLYEISEQTISFMRGALQIFRPENEPELATNYASVPAVVNGIKYELTESSGLALNDAGHKENGWPLFFYNIGGLWNARNFVVKMLQPPATQGQ